MMCIRSVNSGRLVAIGVMALGIVAGTVFVAQAISPDSPGITGLDWEPGKEPWTIPPDDGTPLPSQEVLKAEVAKWCAAIATNDTIETRWAAYRYIKQIDRKMAMRASFSERDALTKQFTPLFKVFLNDYPECGATNLLERIELRWRSVSGYYLYETSYVEGMEILVKSLRWMGGFKTDAEGNLLHDPESPMNVHARHRGWEKRTEGRRKFYEILYFRRSLLHNKTVIAFVRRYMETLDAEKRAAFRADFIRRAGLNEKEAAAFLGPEPPGD